MKKILFILLNIVSILLVAYASIFQTESIKFVLLFLVLGFGLAFLRLFVNHSIKKMKGKHFGVKIIFFAVLLGLGLPFQNWFRTNVIMTLDQSYIFNCIAILLCGIIIMTMIANKISSSMNEFG
ncbi:MFS transporter permease [Macrococcoides caseolyticum]|uniref:MFS transporter permease n=1 Tax=Macrococcoides caseolyticum TaxID=69966 RepID=UPI001F187E98|nr:MFS transporter permease [Macrococcus caseolyticus]MCE4956644.1 MFS transporter permease [Macrococcus caseolyticus]